MREMSCERNSSLEHGQQGIHNAAGHSLDDRFDHLLTGGKPISPDGLDPLGVKARFRFVDGFIFEADISLLRHQERLRVHLRSG
jgi:hypothetical protein